MIISSFCPVEPDRGRMEEEQRIDVGQEGELADNVIYQDATEICCNTDIKKTCSVSLRAFLPIE